MLLDLKVKAEWGYSTTLFADAERQAGGTAKEHSTGQGAIGSMDKATVRPGGWGGSVEKTLTGVAGQAEAS